MKGKLKLGIVLLIISALIIALGFVIPETIYTGETVANDDVSNLELKADLTVAIWQANMTSALAIIFGLAGIFMISRG